MEVIKFDSVSRTICTARVGKRGSEARAGPKGRASPRRSWYIKKSSASIKKIQKLITKLYDYTQSSNYTGSPIIWLTLTTQQHKTGKTDKELFHNIKLFFQHRPCSYINVVERQRNTGDIHFHLVVVTERYFDFDQDTQRWSDLCGVTANPNMFDAREIYDLKTLRYYISKYVSKPTPSWDTLEKWYERFGDKTAFPYSSLFWCRTTSNAKIDILLDKTDQGNTVFRIPTEYAIHLEKFLGQKRYHEFTDTYDYKDEKFQRAFVYYKMLRRAGLVD